MEATLEKPTILHQEPVQQANLIDDIKNVCSVTGERFETLYRSIILNNNLSEWANVNLWDVLNPQWIEEKAYTAYLNNSTGLKWVELLRNTFILLPITITWLGLSFATQNYQSIANSAEGSFLFLWERGDLGWFTFSRIGFADAALLILLVIFTGIVHANKEFTQSRAAEWAAHLRKDLENAIWEMDCRLAGERYSQNISKSDIQIGNIVELLRRELKHLESMMAEKTQTNETQKQMSNAVRDLNRSISELNKISDQSTSQVSSMLKDSAMQVNRMYDRVNTSIESLAIQLTSMTANQKDFMISLDPLERYLEAVGTINNSLSNAISELKKEREYNLKDHQVIVKAMGQMEEAVTSLNKGDKTLTTALEKMSSSYTALAKELNRVTTETVKDQTDKRTSLAVWVLVVVNTISIGAMVFHFLR